MRPLQNSLKLDSSQYGSPYPSLNSSLLRTPVESFRTVCAIVLCGGSLVLPSVIALLVLRMHAHVEWDMWLVVLHDHYGEHERTLREFNMAVSTWRVLRGRALFDPVAWHAALRQWTRGSMATAPASDEETERAS